MTVDPRVYEIAEEFVNETIRVLHRPVLPSQRQPWIQRAAEAMQQAIEDECQDIERELTNGIS